MITLDTNILARLLLNDEPRQFAVARTLLAQPEVFTAPPTILLELVWVLQVNGCTRDEIVGALHRLLALPNFEPQSEAALIQALDWYKQGLDFADALHLALSGSSKELLTFDHKFVTRAARREALPQVKLLKT